MKVCKNCGEINTNDCDFCINCGQTNFMFREELICPHCGAVNDKSFAYCINCGNDMTRPTRLDTSKVVEPSVEARNMPSAGGSETSYTAVPVDLREQLSDVYGGLSSSTPTETATCPSCGAVVPIHAIYCSACGASVERLHEHRVVKRKICPHCNRPNSLEAQYCAYCFSPLQTAETQEMQVVHDSKQVGSDIVRQAYLADEHGKKKICSNCGALNPMDELFCVSCGLKLDAEEQVKYCPNCGAENSVGDTFCTKCQWSFTGSSPNSQDKWKCSKCHNMNDGHNHFCQHCGARKVIPGRKK